MRSERNFEVLMPASESESRKVVDEIYAEISEPVTNNFYRFLMGERERLMLYEIALGLHNRPETVGYVLEFGSWCLGSAIMMTKAMKKRNDGYLPIVTVDAYHYNPKNPFNIVLLTYLESRRLHFQFGEGEIYSHLIRVANDCIDFMKVWAKPLRVVFIDTIGDYEHTNREIQSVLPHLVDDSWLVFHDYYEPYQSGLIDAINHFLDADNGWKIKPYLLVEEIGPNNSTVGLHMIEKEHPQK